MSTMGLEGGGGLNVDPAVIGMDLGTDKSLLIVDDDKAFCLRLARAMETRGFVVVTASSVAEGLAAIAETPPAFAIIDMRLADGNGLDVISDLKARRNDARAIILTGYGNIVTAVTAVKLGAFDYLAKPADADEIYNALMATQHDKAALPENPMSADRVRWEHIQRIYELWRPQCLGDRPSSQHAPSYPAADSRQRAPR